MTKSWNDIDPTETKEWLAALASVIKEEGEERAQYILQRLFDYAESKGVAAGLGQVVTPYRNTISVEQQPAYPGDLQLEAAIEALVRWNAIAMVIKAKATAGGVGGHLSSFASIATLYEVGLNHFFHGPTKENPGDLIYFQGHSSEGNYARAFLEGRITEEELNNFRQEAAGGGVSSYPHPWLMPHFWQFATVSLGLGLLQGVYQAQFLKYMENRGLLKTAGRKVWVFCGDGEMDEPESIGGLTIAAREKLDNLIFVVNCNLQRLDGLVRGNSQIVQELEGVFRGAGWNVIKVLWGSEWDALFAKDKSGALLKRLSACVDGDLQTAYVRGPAYLREFIFNSDELKTLVADLSDDDIAKLHRGAHDPLKIYAAYAAAAQHKNQPSIILAMGVKGYGLGTEGAEGRNIAHNQLEMSEEELNIFCKRFTLNIPAQELSSFKFQQFKKDSPELKYLFAQREKLGGFLPTRQVESQSLAVPALSEFDTVLHGSADRTMSTTMVLGRLFNVMLKHKIVGPRVVPIFLMKCALSIGNIIPASWHLFTHRSIVCAGR